MMLARVNSCKKRIFARNCDQPSRAVSLAEVMASMTVSPGDAVRVVSALLLRGWPTSGEDCTATPHVQDEPDVNRILRDTISQHCRASTCRCGQYLL